MMAQEIDEMFSFKYEKTAKEIRDKSKEKIDTLTAKIKEREGRVTRIREQHKITDADMAELYEQRSRQGIQSIAYKFSNSAMRSSPERMEERTIEANVVNGIFTERDAIAADTSNIKKLNMIIRNLRPLARTTTETAESYTEDAFVLTDAELEFLGF